MPFYKPTDKKGLYHTLRVVNEYGTIALLRTDPRNAAGTRKDGMDATIAA